MDFLCSQWPIPTFSQVANSRHYPLLTSSHPNLLTWASSTFFLSILELKYTEVFRFFLFYSLESRVSKLRNKWTSFREFQETSVCLCQIVCASVHSFGWKSPQCSSDFKDILDPSENFKNCLRFLLGKFHHPPRLKWLPSKSQYDILFILNPLNLVDS